MKRNQKLSTPSSQENSPNPVPSALSRRRFLGKAGPAAGIAAASAGVLGHAAKALAQADSVIGSRALDADPAAPAARGMPMAARSAIESGRP